MSRKAIIIGAGPAGLTAAYELLKRTDIVPIILEKSGDIGGISKTINYKGNRMDMGPHRFFSKSDRVMNWWLNIMPLEDTKDTNQTISYQNKTREINQPKSDGEPFEKANASDKRMLVIQRLTRIYFLRKFFAYPIQLSLDTLKTLGFVRTIKIMLSFLWIRLFPRKPEKSLEDFIINKFGRELYLLFFKDYTEKVWGVPCQEISAEWGAQRIKGVSLSKAIAQAVKSVGKKKGKDLSQKETETSLIEQFLYPKYGPGSLWEEVARQVEIMGGRIYLNQDVQHIHVEDGNVTSVNTINNQTGQAGAWEGLYFFSTMPVQELIAGIERANPGTVPTNVQDVAAGLQYRDFINVGILLKRLSKPAKDSGKFEKLELKDNWIYIQERDVKVGRLMIYNNWGGGMIKDPNTTWIGMEYFCNKTDQFWALNDEAIQKLAIEELEKMELACTEDVLDITVARMEKTYPAYFGTYERFNEIKDYVNRIENLFLVGRNGMHKYNNADHSMLCSMVAVDNITQGIVSKENLWAINTEQEYHEVKKPNEKKELSKQQLPQGAMAESNLSFKEFVLRKERTLLITGIVFSFLQFLVFKLLYPQPNFMFDSYAYLDGAIRNLDINMWPIGYSKFLRLVDIFSHSDLILVTIQYVILQCSLVFLLFTIFYFVKPSKPVKWLLLIFYCINPAMLSISNYVLSDGIFTGLSLFWFTQLIWIRIFPTKKVLLIHAFLLFILFTLRYNALYYPLISIVVVSSTRINWRNKLLGPSIAISLIALFIFKTTITYKEETGFNQFSAFSGWMLANDAMIMYRNLPMDKENEVPQRFLKLHQMVSRHLDSIRFLRKRPDSSIQLYYMWIESSPLQKYVAEKYKNDSVTPYFKRWSSVAPLYQDYAKYLIAKHPFQYAKYFLTKNAFWYGMPPTEFLGTYNLKRDSVEQAAVYWFHYKNGKVKSISKKIKPIRAYPIIMASINGLFFFALIGMILFKLRSKINNIKRKIIDLTLFLLVCNIAFSLISAPIVLRYQLFPMVLLLSFCSIIFDIIFAEARKPTLENLPTIVKQARLAV